jgi:DNA-binding GntR family transcriptional regulator
MVGVIGYKEIYEAWENEYKSTIDDFKEEGAANATQAVSTNWLEQIPKVLCLQLNRLDYDEKHKE